MENEIIKPANKKKRAKVSDIILTTVGVLLLLITSVFVVSKFISIDSLVFGVRSDIVLTSSMATLHEEVKEEYEQNGWTNQIAVHDWIFTTKVNDESELQVGDIVTYRNPIAGITTHRIIDIKTFQGSTYFTIRADAVKKSDFDGDFKFDTIIGKVTTNAGQFGQVIYFFQTIYGIILLVGLAMICFVYSFLSDYISNKKPKDEKQN